MCEFTIVNNDNLQSFSCMLTFILPNIQVSPLKSFIVNQLRMIPHIMEQPSIRFTGYLLLNLPGPPAINHYSIYVLLICDNIVLLL